MPVWNVYIEDFNKKQIKVFNVFDSVRFYECCFDGFKVYKKDKDIKKLETNIKASVRYSFWSKREYEIELTCLFHDENFKNKKIDVYDQLCLNWDAFFKYILENESHFKR